MEFNTLCQELQNSTEMIRALLSGVAPEEAQIKPGAVSWSILEAMACGAVIIGSDTPPVAEVIEDGRNGLLVDFFDPKAVADRVDAALDHPERMAAIRETARRSVVERFDLRSVCLPAQVRLIEALHAGRSPDL